MDRSSREFIEATTMLYSKSLIVFCGYTLNLTMSFQYCELVLMGCFCQIVNLFANIFNTVKMLILIVNLLRLRTAMVTISENVCKG